VLYAVETTSPAAYVQDRSRANVSWPAISSAAISSLCYGRPPKLQRATQNAPLGKAGAW
jgi:hypothetical protein